MIDPDDQLKSAKEGLAAGLDAASNVYRGMTLLCSDRKLKDQLESWADSLKDLASRIRTGDLADGDDVLTVALVASGFAGGLPAITATTVKIMKGQLDMAKSKRNFDDQLEEIMKGL